MEDAEAVAMLRGAQRTVEMQAELEEAMREGFVNLSSARFSRGFAGVVISPATFPESARATALAGPGERPEEQPAAVEEDASGLRQRKKGPKTEETAAVEQPSKAEPDAVRQWLGIQPRGQLERSRQAFQKALATAVALAEHNVALLTRAKQCT